MVLQADYPGHVRPGAAFVGVKALPPGHQPQEGDVVLTAGHGEAAQNHLAGVLGQVAHHRLGPDGLALIPLRVLHHVHVPHAEVVVGDVYIGTGETDAVRLIAKAARELYQTYPGIHYHIASGNAVFVMEQLEKGLIDFGLVFGAVDQSRYNYIRIPLTEVWGVLMRKDSPLAAKPDISPEDLWDKPLILSRQEDSSGALASWIQREISELEIVATYNLLFNASLMVDEGLGYAIGFDKIINTSGNSNLCFRPLNPRREDGMCIIWKKYQVFSKASEKFMAQLKETQKEMILF